MRQGVKWAVIAVMVALVAAGGCRSQAPLTPPGPQMTPVLITAYVNVSSGCQQETLDLLDEMAAAHPNVQLTVIDFGDGGEGARQWQESGHTCMTIEIDGSQHVKYPGPEGETISTLEMPPGFQWTLDELRAAITAAAEGKLQVVSEADAQATEAAVLVSAEVEIKVAEEGAAVVLVDHKPIMRLEVPLAGKSAQQRAEAAAETLQQWLSEPVQPTQIEMKAIKEEAQILVGGKLVVTVTDDDARAASSRPRALGKEWATSLRQAVVGAVASQAKKTAD